MGSLLGDMLGSQSSPSKDRVATYGSRTDGSKKSTGYFGELLNTDGSGRFSTELSSEATIDGKKLLFPLLVPTLNKKEIDILLSGDLSRHPKNKTLMETIYQKAIDFAISRQKQGKDPFAQAGEQVPIPTE